MSPVSPSSATATASLTVPLREAAIDLNHWYVVASSRELTDRPLAVELWGHELVLYRDRAGQPIALEDRCPHRFVKLSTGQVQGDQLECVYHGWRFAADGTCAAVPYLGDRQKLPPCRIPTYPVREQDGFIWLYPGDVPRDRPLPEPMALPEWTHLNYIASVAPIDCRGHFSFLIENLMDMHHGRLHEDYQAWASAKLDHLEATGDRVDAHYTAQSYYRIDQIWSVAQLFIPALRRPHPEPLTVSYRYPHWASSLGAEFRIYCLFCPVSRDRTRAYLVHFTSLEAFDRLHKLPIPFRQFIKNSLFNCAKGMLDGLVRQDVLMIEQEQAAYGENPRRRGPELNPTLAAVQRLIRDRAPRPPSP